MRPATVTGHRLGMEPAIKDGFVFFPAVGAHFKRLHGRFLPVVWKVPDDGKPRATVGTVHKGIIHPGTRDFHIIATVAANSNVRTDLCNFTGNVMALENGKFPEYFIICRSDGNFFNH